MSKETRFCPFRRVLARQRTRITENRAEENFKDRFDRCLRLEKKEEQDG